MIQPNDCIAKYMRAREAARQRYVKELQKIAKSLVLLRTVDVAKRFNVTRPTVCRWVHVGLLQAVDGGELGFLFDPEEVERFTPPPKGRLSHRGYQDASAKLSEANG